MDPIQSKKLSWDDICTEYNNTRNKMSWADMCEQEEKCNKMYWTDMCEEECNKTLNTFTPDIYEKEDEEWTTVSYKKNNNKNQKPKISPLTRSSFIRK